MYEFLIKERTIAFDPEHWDFSVKIRGEKWEMVKKPYAELKNGKKLFLTDGECRHNSYETGVVLGVEAVYTFESSVTAMKIITHMEVEKHSGRIHFMVRTENDAPLEITELRYPGAFSLNAEKGRGYTLFPVCSGGLIPAKDSDTINGVGGNHVYGRSMYMPFFGQMRNGTGFMAVYETPYDAKHYLQHISGGDTTVEMGFIESLGTIRYQRQVFFDFYEECTYVSIAKKYRQYVKETGLFVSLNEKAAKNPRIRELYGVPFIRKNIKLNISKESKRYNPDDPAENYKVKTFDEAGEQVRALKDMGIDRALILLSGWQNDGFDHKHPDVFPIDPAVGGEEGFKKFQETCHELGYWFCLHDQYRDYYYDAESFSFDNATLQPDGSYPFCDTWHGGPHSYLCTRLVPEYLSRNYEHLTRDAGIRFDAYYLDVMSVVELDECCCPDHLMTREQCVMYRNRLFHYLTAQGSAPCSEAVVDCFLPSLVCGHASYLVNPGADPGSRLSKEIGIPIPLFGLVYHDCIITPWRASARVNVSEFGVPRGDSHMIHAALNGHTLMLCNDMGPQNLDDYEKEIRILNLHHRVADQEMVNHEFIDGNIRKQRTTFADGTRVEADLDANTFRVIYPV